MTPSISSTQLQSPVRQSDLAGLALKSAAVFWFCVTAVGQLIFVLYLMSLYGGAVVRGNLSQWNKVVPHAYVAGDTVGNTAMGMHVLFAIVITVGGLIQLVPMVRRLAPRFHRWNGRLYVLLAVMSSLAGLYMVWIRGSTGDFTQHVGISIDAVLIMLCAAMAVRHARAGRVALHRQWALRLFLVVSAVWFFRIGLMFWIMLNKAPVGFDPETFTGPTLSIISFAQFLLPLAVLELYLRARDGGSGPGRVVVAAGLVVMTLLMGVGIFAATVILWLPRM